LDGGRLLPAHGAQGSSFKYLEIEEHLVSALWRHLVAAPDFGEHFVSKPYGAVEVVVPLGIKRPEHQPDLDLIRPDKRWANLILPVGELHSPQAEFGRAGRAPVERLRQRF